jgi:phenylacetate-CoA ligase
MLCGRVVREELSIASRATGIAWPAVPTAAAATIISSLFQLDRTQWWPPEAIAERQWAQLDLLFAHALSTVPFYKDRLGSSGWSPGTAMTPEAWASVPILTRSDAQEAGEALRTTALPADHGKTWALKTSGSTGRPLETLSTEMAQYFWRVLTLREHLWHGRDFSLKHAVIREFPGGRAPGGVEGKAQSWGLGVFRTGPTVTLHIDRTIAEQAEWLTYHRPSYLLTYPSNLLALARYFADRGETIPGLIEARTLGEVVDDALRPACREAWGVPLVDMYSTQEAGYIALQCPDNEHYHVQSENLVVEVLNDDGEPCLSGERGRVVVSTLHNFATPLLRYDVGDFAEVGGPCSCGRGLPVITRVLGRQRNVFIRPDGERIWPSLGDAATFRRAVGDDFPPVRQFQIIQRTLDSVELKVAMDRRLQSHEQERLHAHLQESLGARFGLTVTYVDEIPRSAGGKFEDFRSEVRA